MYDIPHNSDDYNALQNDLNKLLMYICGEYAYILILLYNPAKLINDNKRNKQACALCKFELMKSVMTSR